MGVFAIGIPIGRGRQKKISEEIMAGHFPKLMTNDESIESGITINIHTRNRKKRTPSLIIIKILKNINIKTLIVEETENTGIPYLSTWGII